MMGKPKPQIAPVFFAMGLCLVSISARATDQVLKPVEKQGAHAEAHDDHHHRFFAGIKGAFLSVFTDGKTHLFGGGGLFFEVALGPVELELCARVLGNRHGVILPVDLLLKLPFHLTKTIHPFIGIGPTLVPVFLEENAVHVGLASAVGSYFWLTDSLALAVEVNYNLVFEEHLAQEIMGNFGVVFGW